MTKLIVAFDSFAKAPKNSKKIETLLNAAVGTAKHVFLWESRQYVKNKSSYCTETTCTK